jgi:hypothetical protein
MGEEVKRDLIRRLWESQLDAHSDVAKRLMAEAAQMLEGEKCVWCGKADCFSLKDTSLRTERDRLESQLKVARASTDNMRADAVALMRERDRMREALRDILQYLDEHDWGNIPEGATADRAHAALKSEAL